MSTATAPRKRRTSKERLAMQEEALSRAANGRPNSNYLPIYIGFIDKGIPEDQIEPRRNVFTYTAWQALGRQVRKGEKGVKVTTWIPRKPKKGEVVDPKKRLGVFPRTATVFHVSQTDPAS